MSGPHCGPLLQRSLPEDPRSGPFLQRSGVFVFLGLFVLVFVARRRDARALGRRNVRCVVVLGELDAAARDLERAAGLGLGLAVAQGLASAVGAELTAEDTPGGGLTMVLSVPVADQATP